MKKIIFLIVFLCIVSLSYSKNEFVIREELPPLELKYSDFVHILQDANLIIAKFDTNFHEGEIILRIEKENEKQIFDNIKDIENIKIMIANEISYQYSNYHGIIRNLSIDLNDYNRTIEIHGNNYTEIETIINLLQNKLITYKKVMGGVNFRSSVSTVFTLLVLLLIFLLFYSIDVHKLEFVKRNTNLGFLQLFLTLSVAILFNMFYFNILDLKNLFPGFRIYKDEISFIKKYSDYFTFWGFILAVFSFPLFKFLFRKSKREG